MFDYSLSLFYRNYDGGPFNRNIQEAASPAYQVNPNSYPNNSTRSLVLPGQQVLNQSLCSQQYFLWVEGEYYRITIGVPEITAQSVGPRGQLGSVQEEVLQSPPSENKCIPVVGNQSAKLPVPATNPQAFKPYVRGKPGRPRPPESEQALVMLQQGQPKDDVYGWWIWQQGKEHTRYHYKRFNEMISHAKKTGHLPPGKQIGK